jgi:F-type H+-transporting ATPase subunit gamma
LAATCGGQVKPARRCSRGSTLIGTVKVMLDAYENGEASIACSGQQRVRQHHDAEADVQQLLPLQATRKTAQQNKHRWDYIYEPDAKELLDARALTRFIESQVYQAVVENNACEQAARMVAMKVRHRERRRA